MKILMLSDVFFPDTTGGAGRVAYNLARELSRRKHEVHAIIRNPAGMHPASDRLNDYFYLHRFNSPSEESLRLIFYEIKNSYTLSKQIARHNTFDLICLHQSLPSIGLILNGMFNQTPVVYCFHSPWHQEYLLKKQRKNGTTPIRSKTIALALKTIEKQILNRACKIFTLSRFMSDTLKAIHRNVDRQTGIIPGGIDLDHFNFTSEDKESIRSRLELPPGKKLFLTVRNLVPRMGIENLIECFHKSGTLKDNGYLLIGGSGIHKDYLLSLVQSYQLDPHVRFLGHISEETLPEIYQSADFFILPTAKLEGFGLVILESMACGTPVLGTPAGAIPEILNRFDERLVFDGVGWNEMKIKLEQIIEKPEQYEFDPKDCRHFVEQNYSWKKMADGFEKKALELI